MIEAAQRIIFSALATATTRPIYDSPPQIPEGMPRDAFPYIVFGEDDMTPWDTTTSTGGIALATVHFWSISDGFKEVKTLMGAAYDALHRAELTDPEFQVVDCLLEFQEALRDPDGATKHGVQRYKVTMERI